MIPRSRDYISNLAIVWRDVDLFLLVESQPQDASGGERETMDGLFWQGTVSAVRPQLRTQTIHLGGKGAVLEAAHWIAEESGDLPKAVACMDSDYDRLLGAQVVHSRVFYTWGYSWENDVIIWDAVAALIYQQLQIQDGTFPLSELRTALEDVVAVPGEHILRVDVLLHSQGNWLKDKSKPMHLFIVGDDGPTVDSKAVEDSIDKFGGNAQYDGDVDFWRDFHGRSLAVVLSLWLEFVTAKYPRTGGFKRPFVFLALLRAFHTRLGQSSLGRFGYYRQMVSAA